MRAAPLDPFACEFPFSGCAERLARCKHKAVRVSTARQCMSAALHCLACCVQSPNHQQKLGGCVNSQLTLQRARGSYLCPQPWHLAGVSRHTSHLQHRAHATAGTVTFMCLRHRHLHLTVASGDYAALYCLLKLMLSGVVKPSIDHTCHLHDSCFLDRTRLQAWQHFENTMKSVDWQQTIAGTGIRTPLSQTVPSGKRGVGFQERFPVCKSCAADNSARATEVQPVVRTM
jgi:hypothetical protein